MDEREFLDTLFQLYSRTTGGETTYWRPESTQFGFSVFAVDPDDRRTTIAESLAEVDADWITAIHGALPDLVRRMHAALDEADAADVGRDARECRIAELELENAELRRQLDARQQQDA